MILCDFSSLKEEKEIERKVRIRKAKAQLKSYISGLESLQKKVLELGRRARSEIGSLLGGRPRSI